MSISDSLRLADLEATVAALAARTAALEDMVVDTRAFCEARQGAGTPTGVAGGLDCKPLSQRPSSEPVDDTVMAGVIEALETGQSIRGAAQTLNLDRNKVARLRQRAIAEGRFIVSPA